MIEGMVTGYPSSDEPAPQYSFGQGISARSLNKWQETERFAPEWILNARCNTRWHQGIQCAQSIRRLGFADKVPLAQKGVRLPKTLFAVWIGGRWV